MAHDHVHVHDSNYYMEQLCSIAAAGALGGVAIMMWCQEMLKFLLHPAFHVWVLAGGISLVVLAVLRGVTLWLTAEPPHHAHHHHHEHDHHHGECAHEHHGHEHHGHHHHEHHGHDHHTHDHQHDDGHSHDFAPWRYAVLLLPVVLYFLNMPNQGFSTEGIGRKLGSEVEIDSETRQMARKGSGVTKLGFKELAAASFDPTTREFLEGQMGSLVGQYWKLSDKECTLFRLKITCCASDAIPLKVRILSDKNLPNFKQGSWVEVTGQIQFRQVSGKDEFIPVLQLEGASTDIVPTEPENDFTT